ncbi:hypothetical protein BGX29_003679, partial [Mortierella sp. GBA35]
VPKSGAVPRSVAAPSSIPKQSSTPSKASSYATAATPKKKGITGSNPVSVQSSASVYASARTHTVSSAAATPAAAAAPSAVPSDWLVQRINEMSARISATDSRFEKYIHAQIQAMEARLEAKLDRFINALGAAHGLTPSAIEPEDIELEQAADLSDEIIPATPPSQLPSIQAPAPFPPPSPSTSAAAPPSPVQQKPYSVDMQRPHHRGGVQISKVDSARDEQALGRKTVVARTEPSPQQATSEQLQQQIHDLTNQNLALQKQMRERELAIANMLSKTTRLQDRYEDYLENTADPSQALAGSIPLGGEHISDHDFITYDPFRALTVATFNVRGGNATNFFNYLADHITTLNITILGVQETKLQANKDHHLLFRDSTCQYTGLWNHPTTHFNSKGVGLLVHKTWSKYIIETFSDNNGRGIGALFGFKHGFRLAVINCYFPPQGSNSHKTDFQPLHEWATAQIDKMQNAGVHVLMLGDFNGVVNPAIDRASSNRASSNPELRFRLDMVWASPGLASYLIRTTVKAPDQLTPSDHSIMLSTFDLHTLIHPADQAKLAAERPRGKKLLLDKVEEDSWEAYANQIEEFLPRYGGLDNDTSLQFPDSFRRGAEMVPFSIAYLSIFPLDRVWKALREIVMSSAYAHLPCAKTGGMPPLPDGEGRFRAQISDLGNIIRSTREAFVTDPLPDMALRQATHRQIVRWYKSNGEEMGLTRVPSLDDPAEEWREWMSSVQTHWRQARLQHQDYFAANKQDIINAHIENRDSRFQTHTKATLRSILDEFTGRVNLDHLIVDDDSAEPCVIDDPKEIKDR